MSVIATLISDRPIKVMMVPVTTGVISIRSLPMNWLSTTSMNAAKKAHAKNRRENFIGAAAPGLDHETGAEYHADEGKTGALQAQQTGADRAETLGLNERAEARDEQCHADQVWNFALQPQGAAHDQGRGDDADEAGQHVLQRGEHGGGEVRTVVEAVDQIVVARDFFRGGHGDFARREAGPGQKMEAQDAGRGRRGQRAKIA